MSVSRGRKEGESLEDVILIAQKIKEKANQKSQIEKTIEKEVQIRSKYDLNTSSGIVQALASAQEHARDDTNQSIYEAAWLNGYARGLGILDKAQNIRNTSLDQKIQSASTRSAETLSNLNVKIKDNEHEL